MYYRPLHCCAIAQWTLLIMKRIHYLLAPLFAGLALAGFVGCSTPYQKSGFTGGFKEAQKGRNKFVVGFSGNGYTTGERAGDLCLLRCAELTLAHGFHYFILTDNQSHIDTSTSVTTGTYGGGLMFATTQSIPKPSTLNTFLCFRNKPTGFNDYFDAQRVYANLASKYRVTKQPDSVTRLVTGKAVIGIFFEMKDGLMMGPRILAFADGSAAESAGLKKGDTVLAFNGISLQQKDAMQADSANWQPGQIIEVKVERG